MFLQQASYTPPFGGLGLRDSLNKFPWMRRMDVKPVPTEGRDSRLSGNDGDKGELFRGSRLRGNDGLQAAGMTGTKAGMTGFRRVVQRFLR